MRKMNRFAGLFMAVASVVAMSCDNNDEIKVTDPNAEFDAVLKVKEDSSENANFDYIVTSGTGETIKAKVTFETTTASMKRLYITRNVQGLEELPYEPSENIDLKADGAVDLEGGDDNKFTYQFELPVPDTITTGTVVYSFWTTTGNGDFRDKDKRLAVGPGTITIKYGAGTNPDADNAELVSYSDIKLFAPLADGSSATFFSLLDGEVYKINQGAEYASRWDFGYYFTNAAGASLASTANYEASFSFVNVDQIAGTTDLNEAKFALSSLTSAEFDAASVAGDIDFTNPTQQKISGLEAGDIIEFVDAYGHKGLIRVDAVVGTFNSTDYIQIDIKVQP